MLSYRKELEGLRALAVIAVIIYHANLKLFGVQLFQGGFFGVDVFFVLSGYLITGIIRHKMEQGTFSFRDFYWRRAKRIVPAFLTMLLITSGLAYLILLPDDLVVYAKSLQSALYLGSNHFFYSEDSYTAAASIYRPLLHTWSLSVEWQFYVVFPFVIWVINRFFPRYMFGLLLALALVSLQISSFIVKVNPDMAFYLLPTRAWELILGDLVTFYNRTNIGSSAKGSVASIAYQSLPLIGLFIVVHSMVFIGHNVPHPSFITLLPVLGTCLFIMFSHKGDVTHEAMSLKPVVGIGLVSYSLYLWHQPVFVFFRFIKHDYFRYEQFLLLVLVSFAFAICSYFFVENPFRKKEISRKKIIFILIVLLISSAFSFFVQKQRGYPERLGVVTTLFKDLNDNSNFKMNGIRCHNQPFDKSCRVMSDKNNVLLLGDSHAGSIGKHLYNESLKQGMGYINLTPSGCTGINTVRVKRKIKGEVVRKKPCEVASEKISAFLESPTTPKMKIVFVTRLPQYLSGKVFNNGLGGLEAGEDYWIEANNGGSAKQAVLDKLSFWASLGHELVLVYPIPEMGWDIPKRIQQILGEHVLPKSKKDAYNNLIISVPETTYQKRTSEAFDLLNNVEGKNVSRVYPHKVFCTEGHCAANDATSIYYYDDDHLSTHGAKLLVNEIAKYLR